MFGGVPTQLLHAFEGLWKSCIQFTHWRLLQNCASSQYLHNVKKFWIPPNKPQTYYRLSKVFTYSRLSIQLTSPLWKHPWCPQGCCTLVHGVHRCAIPTRAWCHPSPWRKNVVRVFGFHPFGRIWCKWSGGKLKKKKTYIQMEPRKQPSYFPLPIGSMYGIFTYISNKSHPNV